MTHNTIPLEQARAKQNDIFKVYDLITFLDLDIPPKEDILSPILQTQSLSMLYAKRGIGKTHIGLNIALAISSGTDFLMWSAPTPRKTLYIDGEMPAITIQQRLKDIAQTNEKKHLPDYFNIFTPDMQIAGMPDLSTPEGQEQYEPFVEDAEFIIIDNISTLARTGKENEAEGWLPIQAWALNMRSRGKSVMFIHHAGKGGQQRGTSRREDVLDLVMTLKHPEDYKTQDGARFEVHYEKARNLIGNQAKPFEAKLTPHGWTYCDIEDAEFNRVIDLHKDGLSTREIEEETGVSKSKANRIIKKYKEEM